MAQVPVAGLTPHIDLQATLDSTASNTRSFSGGEPILAVQVKKQAAPGEPIFPKTKPVDEGWKGLARLLEALTPNIDTSIPLTPSEVTGRIAALLNAGQNQAALDAIEKRVSQREQEGTIGTDVQLMFLHARALAALGRENEAVEIYRDMTAQYPELPEPWNNLAALYAAQGRIDQAKDALDMALTANPQYAAAQANLGRVQLMLAQESFDRAAGLGIGKARVQAEETRDILEK